MDLDDYDTDFKEDDDSEAEYDNNQSLDTDVDDICCSNKCLLTFDDEFKDRLKMDMSRLQRFEKHIYLFAMISIDENKINATKIIKSSKYFQYAVKHYGVNRSVCKSAFVTLHDTTLSLVRTLCMKMTIGHIIPTDNRGKHNNRLTIPDETKVAIKEHFFSILKSPNVS